MYKTKLAAAALTVLAATSCSDSEFDGFKKDESGLHYRFFNRDENGTKVQTGDGILIRYVIMNHRNDSVIVDSKNVSHDGSGYTGFNLSRGSSFRGSLEDGMMMMSKGDSAEFIVRADSFFIKSMGSNELPPGIRNTDYLRAQIKIKDIKRKADLEKEMKERNAAREKKAMEAEQNEKPALEKYLADNKISATPNESGVYYIETKKGSGPNPKPTDVVTVHYTGKLLDGTVFDSSEGQEPRDFGLNQVIPGWAEGLQKMRKGSKATMIIPSNMAYGAQGTPGGPIPPFAALVFTVELLDFKTGAPGQQQP